MNIAQSLLRMGAIAARFSVDSGFTPVVTAYSRDDTAVCDNAGELALTQRARRRLFGNLDTNSVGYANAPNLAVTINRTGGIAFDYWLLYATSDPTEGIGVQLAFTGAANGIGYSVEAYTDPTTRAPLVTASAFGSGLAAYAAGPGPATPCIIKIAGSANVTTVGDLNVQIRAKTGGANIATLLYPSWGAVSAS
jgi:hypothetical protein